MRRTKNKRSIRWKIFFHFLLFAIILIVLLWFFQVIYLEKFYMSVKAKEAQKAIGKITAMVDLGADSLSASVDEIAMENEVSIAVFDSGYNAISASSYLMNSNLSIMPTDILSQFVELARENGNELTINFESGKDLMQMLQIYGQPQGDNPPQKPEDSRTEALDSGSDNNGQKQGDLKDHVNFGGSISESIIYLQIVDTDTGEYYVLLHSQLSPVDATVNTIRIQLVYISIILIGLAFVMAVVVSNIVSRSIIKINNTAKRFGEGDFEVTFDGADYREVAELSDTLNYAASELGKTEALRKELIANVSHDLRTPLTMITAYSEIMRDLPEENTPENVQVIIDEAMRLTNLVNDMLDVSKLQAGVMTLNKKVYNLTESISAVMDRYQKLKEQDGYRISFERNGTVFVDADEYKIYQVIYNLVNNAINYTGDDKVVTVRQKIFADHVRIEVSDTGEGIAKDKVNYVWERYYKVDKTHKRAVAGTGLGLSIVKNILELHGAKYGVDSIVGKGSTFWFALRTVPEPDEDI